MTKREYRVKGRTTTEATYPAVICFETYVKSATRDEVIDETLKLFKRVVSMNLIEVEEVM